MIFSRQDKLLVAISPMIVWGGYFGAVYALQGLGCDRGWNRLLLPVGNVLTAAMLVLTLAALAMIAWSGLAAWRAWRGIGASRSAGGIERSQRQHFMGLVGFALAILAAIATVFTGIPIIMLEPCAI